MSKVLEIFGKGMTVQLPDVIRHWIDQSMGSTAEDAAEMLGRILDCIANRETVPAREKIAAYLSAFPDCTVARMAAAAVCLLEGDLTGALEQTHSVYWRQPSNTMALYVLGYCHERLGHVEHAIEFYQDCVKFKNYLQLPHQRLAALYLKDGRLDRAVQEYEILTSEHPDDISSIILLGYLYLAADRASQAVDTFNLAILSHPDNFSQSQKEDDIQSLVECGMYEQALEAVKSTIEAMGPSHDLLIRMGDICSQWDKDTEAIMCYENAIRVQPNSLEAAIKLGTHYLRNKRFSLAAEQFNHAAQMNDEIIDTYIGLATAQKSIDLTKEALQTLNLASSIQKNSVLLFMESATLQFQSIVDENHDLSRTSDKEVVTSTSVIHAYREQLKNHTHRADVLYKYGILMLSEDDFSAAADAFERAVLRNPTYYRAHHNRVLCLIEMRERDAAITSLQMPESSGSGIYEKYYQMTMLYTDKKAFTEAYRKFAASTSFNAASDIEIRAQLEDILETLGVVDRSYMSWERINETSQWLLKLIEKGHFHNPMKF
jgi:tetratricopeptide (TPR) repeat protein